MEYTVNQDFIKEYANRLTADICRQFFVNKAFISGPEILAFHSENQLNLLIVKNIYLTWQKETVKLRSPFFDFEDEDVKQALKSFMQKLSNHIKVYRYDFEPLVAKSISDLILLSCAPAEFFTAEIESLAGPKIPLSLLKDFAKYIRVNRFIIDQVIREIEASGQNETFAGETIRFVRKSILENPDKADKPDTVLAGLLDYQPAAITDFVCQPKPLVRPPSFLDTPRPEAWATTEYVPIARPDTQNEPAAEELESEQIQSAGETLIQAETEDTTTRLQEEDQIFVEEFVAEDAGLADEPVAFVDEAIQEVPNPINVKESPSLHETLKAAESAVLAEAISAAREPAAPFRTLVPMHYRFTFINSLFDGNQDAWTEAVDRIDQMHSLSEAVKMLNEAYASRFNWGEKEDNVSILFNYIERKF